MSDIYVALGNTKRRIVTSYIDLTFMSNRIDGENLRVNFPNSFIHESTVIFYIVLYDTHNVSHGWYPLTKPVSYNKFRNSGIEVSIEFESVKGFIEWAKTVPSGTDGSKKEKAPGKPWLTDSAILGSIRFPTPEIETISKSLGEPLRATRTERNDPVGIERKRWRTADEWQAKLAKETTRKSLRESEAVIYKRSCNRGQGVMFTGMAGALTVSFASPLLPLLFVIVSLSFCALALLSGLVVAAESAKKLTQSAAEARQAQAELDGLYASPPPSQDV